jgi:hypothetical protein
VQRKSMEALWQAWGQPDIWRLPHSHASKSLLPGLADRILRWLAPRLENPAAKASPNRVGGGISPPASHTTGHAGPRPAVPGSPNG